MEPLAESMRCVVGETDMVGYIFDVVLKLIKCVEQLEHLG